MTDAVYFNDHDAYCVRWLGNLFPGATVDARSILDVEPGDLAGHRRVHLFAGIGGWEYALQLAGWPEDEPIWTASLPCQPFSIAGRQQGDKDARHLWPVVRSLIAERRPAIIAGEQVASHLGRAWLAGVRADLEALGYAVGAADLCAAGVGAPHIRQRLYWVADRLGARLEGRSSVSGHARQERPPTERGSDAGVLGNASQRRLGAGGGAPGRGGHAHESDAPRPWSDAIWLSCLDGKARRTQPGLCPLVVRIPVGLGSDRPGEASPFRVITDPQTGRSIGQAPWRIGMLRGYGNAIVPQVAAVFLKAYMEARA